MAGRGRGEGGKRMEERGIELRPEEWQDGRQGEGRGERE
jgi:hypothetical protein